MQYIVLKFGGSSMCEDGYKTMLKQIKARTDEEFRVIVVVSAVGKTTNKLYQIIEHNNTNAYNDIYDTHVQLANKMNVGTNDLMSCLLNLKQTIHSFNCDPSTDLVRKKIEILSFGEILSSILLNSILNKHNVISTVINARSFIRAESTHEKIDPYNLNTPGEFKCVRNTILGIISGFDSNCNVFVTQGFIASTSDCYPCILSRSGSDTSASLIASAVDAERVEIWTDVNGMYTADPNIIPNAQLIHRINYNIAQEIAASGSKVIHPFCSLPCIDKCIPIWIKNTFNQRSERFTVIDNTSNTDPNKIYSISNQKDITVFNIETYDMWNNHGFVSDIFKIFSSYKVDVDIITTSQISVSTTTNETSCEKLEKVFNELKKNYKKVNMIKNCRMVSIIGNDVQRNLSLSKCSEIITCVGIEHLHIKHESSNRMNLSFVVDDIIANKLVKAFHREFIVKNSKNIPNMDIWWRKDVQKLIDIVKSNNFNGYYYNKNDINEKCNMLKSKLTSVDEIYYAMKANNNMDVLNCVIDNGFGIECVSLDEVDYIRDLYQGDRKLNILFTPNYADIDEYRKVFEYNNANFNISVIIDSYQILDQFPDVFRNQKLGIRLDLDAGDGHDTKVITEGSNVKFGMQLCDIDKLCKICNILNVTITLLHTHKGSGILNPYAWGNTLEKLKSILHLFPNVTTLDLGGGLGIFSNGAALNLDVMNKSISKVKGDCNNLKIIIEPGRYIVGESGIILTKVNQIRFKGKYNYLGVNVGMNTLIRPALYNSSHPIYNLTKLNSEYDTNYQVVGNICESGDILGKNVMMPHADIGDVILIENTGAYGEVMSSEYNMRKYNKMVE